MLRLPPQHKSYATFVQPLQCVLQHHVHIHAAITLRFASTRADREEEPIDLETIQTAPAAHRRYPSSPAAATLHGKTHGFVLRLPPEHKPHATFMQPLQCVLQHHVHIHAAITMRRCRTERRNRLTSKRSKPHPPHTGGTLHRRLQPLYTEKHMVSCSSFLPKTSPMQHSCSQNNAFCSLTPPFIECILM